MNRYVVTLPYDDTSDGIQLYTECVEANGCSEAIDEALLTYQTDVDNELTLEEIAEYFYIEGVHVTPVAGFLPLEEVKK